MTKLTDSLFAVEVPEDAINFLITGFELSYWSNFDWVDIEFPEDGYQYLGTIKNGKPDFEVDEYVISKQVPYFNMDEGSGDDTIYMDYFYNAFCLFTDNESFLSILTSKNLDTTKHWLILKTK